MSLDKNGIAKRIAQELIDYVPEAVSVHPKGYLQVNYNLLAGL